jgi:hypothetical protein
MTPALVPKWTSKKAAKAFAIVAIGYRHTFARTRELKGLGGRAGVAAANSG